MKANLDGSSPQTIASGRDFLVGVAVDASHLYWTNSRRDTIVEANLDGSNPQTIASGQVRPSGVAIGP